MQLPETGPDPEPVGIRNISGLTPGSNLGTNGATPGCDDLKDVVAAMRAVNAPFLKPGWIFHPRLLSILENWIGENEVFEIALSVEAAYTVDGTNWNSAFQQKQTQFRATMHHDIGLRRPELFTVVTGVRP